MVRASSVLSRRTAAFGALAAGLGAYYAWSGSLWDASLWWDVAFLSFVLIPAVFGLVYLALPLRTRRGLLPAGLAFVALAWILHEVGAEAVADFAKLAAATALAFWFVTYFETVGWVVLVALVVPWIDAYSVWRGPTENIVEEHPEAFTSVAFAFPVPGEEDSARIGPPDLLFFAFFLAAADRFGLRVVWTWACMTLSFGATIAIAVAADSSGLPALPGLALGFLAPNADILWRRLRAARRSRRSSRPGRGRSSAP